MGETILDKIRTGQVNTEKFKVPKQVSESGGGTQLPRIKLRELPELSAAPSPYASWTGKKGGVDARGVDLEAGAADLESRGKGLGVLDEYIRAAEANLGKLERRAMLTGAQEDLDAWQAAFEPYKAVVDRYNSETKNFERLRGIYNEEAKLSGMDEAGLQKTIDENVRRLEKEADPQKISALNRENERARRRMSEMQQAAEERAARLEGAYAREDELVRGIAKAERGLRRSGDVTELRRMQSELEDVRAQITELGGKADASWLKGAGQQYLGTMQQAAGILVKGDDNRKRESNIRAGEEALAEALEAAIMAEAAGRGDRAETERLRGIVDAIGRPGADKEALLAEFLPGIAEVTEEAAKRNEFAEAGRQAMQEEGAERAAKGAENIEAAKGGKNAAEKILIDVGVQGVNMALDAAIGSVTMLGGSVPLAIRSFGGAAGQASEAGASDARAIAYGVASAAAELLSEKLMDGAAAIYGKGAADDFVDHLVGKIAKTDTGRKAWQLLFASAGEGAEEVITDWVDPALQLIYNGKSLGESYSELEGAEVAYDFMIGAIMGFFGGGIDAVKEPGASTQFFYDAAQNGMSFKQAASAWKTLSKDIMKTETDRAKKLAEIDAMADRIVAQQARSRIDTEKAAARKEADREYFEKYTTRAQANKIVNDEAMKAEWQKKTGVTLEGPKGEQARMVMDESRKKLDELDGVGVAENATATEAETVSKTEEVGEPNAEKVTAAENETVTETAETSQEVPERAQNTVEVQTGTETGKQRNVPTAVQTAKSGGNDAKSAQQTIEILRGRDTDTARYGGVEYSVFYEADGTYTARAVRGDETIWTKSGFKNRTEAVNAMQSARAAGQIAGEIAGEIQQGKAEEMAANKRLEKWSRKAAGVGDWVKTKDRGNYGQVQRIDENGKLLVQFVNREKGTTKTVWHAPNDVTVSARNEGNDEAADEFKRRVDEMRAAEEQPEEAKTPVRPIASEYLGDSDYAVIKYLGASVSLKQNKRGEWVGMFMGRGHNGNVIAETREAALEALDAKMSEAYASAYEAPTDADRAEQAAWEGRETDIETGSVTEKRSMSRAEAEEIAEREGYPMLEDADGNERQAVPEYTWVQSRERGNYGLVTGMEIADGVPMLNVWFENKARGTGMSVAMRPDEVIAVEGEMQTGRPEYTDEDAPPEVDNTPPPDMWLPSEEEYERQRELQESREESKREYQRMKADELTQQIIDQTPRKNRPEQARAVDISKIDVKEKQRKDAERIRLRRERAARTADRSTFTGTDEMKAAGIKVSGSLVRYWTNIQNLMQRNQAEKSINREYGKMLKKYNLRPSSPEVQFARGLANGTYTEADIPKRFNAGIVRDIANVERARSQMKAETLREVKSDLKYREQEKAAIIFADSEKYRATPHGKVTKNFMNERTPERVLRSIYGADKGAQIFNYLFRPVQENNAEAIRWVNKQKEDVSMRFVDSKNVQRDLTKAEKAYAQHVREGEGFAWQAAELEGYDLETYDAHMENFRQLMQLMKRDGYSDVIELVDAVNRGDMSRSEAEDKAPNPELFREVLANRQAAISLPEMESDLRKIVEGMQWYRQIEEEIKNNKEVDAVIIDNAAEAIGEKYDDYYKIINQFLVAHGHDEIGFIPGYAPHMQPEPQRKAWGQALATLGIQLDEVSSLPAAIAGRTADFKPNMRWNPHFQHRLGGETDYNIVKGFESYLKFMSDIIYHTDDIMRLRQAVNYFRTTYGSEEIAANLSAANAIRNASLEEKVNFLHGHTPEGYTPMFMSEANELIDRYVESQYADAENLSKYSEFVTWLENYANLLAGKQSLADRGLEYSGGRLLLNVSRKVMNAFMRANVAGSASSVLNQTAQLPMITTHLGPKYGYQAIRDILTGEVKKADWKNRSDFLTGKKGVDMLEMSDSTLDRFVDKLFTPAQMMDDIISTIAVRGEYLRQIDQGVSDEIALRRADDYARRVMGSRVKGEKPQGFESKRLFAQMAHVFQVEAANQFDYVTSDMPQAIRDLAEREGKVKAAKKVAAVATGYLLQAFLLNRLGEELYGGTPAPFDLFGMAAEFSAAGRDMSTERWLMQLVDNVMENHLGGERVFGTSEDEGAEEFDWANAMEASAYTISNDLPFIRNIAGIMGLGDESLPTVGINEVWQGTKGLWSGAKGDDGRFGGGDADWREIGESALDIAAQIAPGGRQIKKTATGLGTMIEGGSYSGNKLRYPVDGSADKWVQALLFGASALDETDEYYATDARNLSEKQTFVYKALVADGMQRQDAYEAMQRYREVDNDKTMTAAEKANAKRDFITALPISDEAKLETWLDLVLDGEESRKYETARNLMDMGVQWMHVAAALNAQATIDEGDGTASDKATAFAKWVDDYADEHWLEEEAADIMKDGFAFWSMVKQDASTYEELMDSGLSTSQAQSIYSLWANLKPEEGKKSVSEVQKMFALVAQKGMSDDQRYDATAGTLIDNKSMTTESGNPSQYAKLLWCKEAGLSYADYAEAKNANAIDNLYRFGTEAGADAESAYTMAMAVAELKPLEGAKNVSNGQKYEAIGRADVEEVYKMAVMEEWLSESAMERLEQAMDFGLTIEMYGKALQIVPKFDHNNNGYPSHAEYEAAIRSMSGLTNRERAALWQMLANGKKNPFDREVSKAMYKK